MDKLDAEPTIKELCKAVAPLLKRKAPGNQATRWSSPASVPSLSPSTSCSLCWKDGTVPQDMHAPPSPHSTRTKVTVWTATTIVAALSWANIVGKVIARVLLTRLQALGRTTSILCPSLASLDMTFTVRQLQEKSREQGKPLYPAFIELINAFDLVSRKGLFQLPKLFSMIVSYHGNMTGTVSLDGTGLCLSHDTLFGIVFSLLLSSAFDASSGSVTSISAPKHFNVSRLRTKTKFKTVLWRDMIFVDDAAFTTHSEAALHRLINNSPAYMKPLASQSVSRKPIWVPRVSAIAWNQNWRPFSAGRRRIHLPRFHRLCELEPSLRNLSYNRRSHKHHVQNDQESLGIEILELKHLNAHLPSMRTQHVILRQRNLDYLHETRTPLELFPSAMPQMHPRCQVVTPHRQWDTDTCWNPQHVLPSQSAPPEMDRVC